MSKTVKKNRLKRNEEVIIEGELCKIPLSNGIYIYVNSFIWSKLKDHSISSGGRYTTIRVNGISYKLHRYIFHNIFHNPIRPEYKVDHINSNLFDATIENLRYATSALNSRNCVKQENCTSIYKGVSKYNDDWQCYFKVNNLVTSFVYKNELHAAYHYNLLVIEAGFGDKQPLNKIDKPIDFVLRVHHVKQSDLPVGIQEENGKYRYRFHSVHSRSFDTLKEAVNERNSKIAAEEEGKINKILSTPIVRNSYGIPIITFYNKKKEKVIDITIDAHRYYEVKLLRSKYGGGYASVYVNGVPVVLSRYLMNCFDSKKFVDHRNNDKSNYQMNNLKIISPFHNNQNKLSIVGTSSIYVGVSLVYSKKWKSYITYRGKEERFRHCSTEYEAAQLRDMRAYELNLIDSYYKINLPQELQFNLFKKALSENSFNLDYLFY